MIRELLAAMRIARPPGTSKAFYLRLFKSRFGEWRLEYSATGTGGWIKMCALNLDQVSWIASDGWPVVREGEPK